MLIPTIDQSCVTGSAERLLKRGLLAFIVILFFCDIAIYLSLAVSARLQPQYWIALLVVMGGVLAWFSPQTRWAAFRTPVFLWCVLFLLLTLVFYFGVPASHVEQLKERIRDVVLLSALLAIFLMLRADLAFLRKLIVFAVIVGVLVNLVSLMHNNFLRPPGVTWAYRPGGFYINPNESGVALLIGMTLSLGVVSRRAREIYAIFVLAGLAATFSREAILLWVVVVALFISFRQVRWKGLVLFFVILAACAGIFALVVLKGHVLNEYVLSYYRYTTQRFEVFIRGPHVDSSDVYRIELLRAGWGLFTAHPWIGNGIGSTYHWNLPTSTHNMYLLYMDDYGVIGFFLYPLLIWGMVRGAVGETRKLAWTMAILLLLWGFFDHNIVQNYYSLFAIALTAAMSKISADESARETAPVAAEAASG